MTTITHTTKQQPQTVISQQTSIPFCNPKLQNASSSSELQALYQRFPTPNDFFHAYPPALQQRILIAGYTPTLLSEKKDIPSMALLANLYGGSTPAEWLKQQLTSLNALAETRWQMSPGQLDETVSLILCAYPWLTAADICLFIARVKIGTYGPFYGSITPLKIMEFLRQYTSECRKSKSSTVPSAATPAPEPDERKPVTFEVYQETLRKAKAGDPEAILELERPPGK